MLHEPDDESLDSSNTTLTFQGDDEEKRNRRLAQGRPYLLRRSTLGNATGSFKRRSLKLRRSHRERRDPDTEGGHIFRPKSPNPIPQKVLSPPPSMKHRGTLVHSKIVHANVNFEWKRPSIRWFYFKVT